MDKRLLTRSRSITCKYCGEIGLIWAQNKSGKWYLQSHGESHNCPSFYDAWILDEFNDLERLAEYYNIPVTLVIQAIQGARVSRVSYWEDWNPEEQVLLAEKIIDLREAV